MTDTPLKHVKERGEEGDYSDLVLPLDYMILELLTAEGVTFGGLYPIGATVRDVTEQLKGAVPGSIVSSRVRIMRELGLCVPVKMLGKAGKSAWQRSEKADALLKTWKEESGGS